MNTSANIRLLRRSTSSFECCTLPALAAFLQQHGYRSCAVRSCHEYGRYCKASSLLVLYHSGAVVLQGTDRGTSAHLLASFIVEDRQ